jgi:thiol-disulfide isomerase/thioredoxin
MVINRAQSLMLPLAAILIIASGAAAQQSQTLLAVDAAGLKKAVAKQKGKVVFVNFWATWCAPCVAEFPDIVKMYEKYHPKGLEVIAVSFDSDAPAALPFLDKQKATFINLLKNPDVDDEIMIKGFDQDWQGALPASWLFDRAGKRVYFTMGRFDPAALDKQVAGLLAAK